MSGSEGTDLGLCSALLDPAAANTSSAPSASLTPPPVELGGEDEADMAEALPVVVALAAGVDDAGAEEVGDSGDGEDALLSRA